MYFDNLRFGEALAIAGIINSYPTRINNDCFSDSAKKQLQLLDERIAKVKSEEKIYALLEFKNNHHESREIIENYFICSFCRPPEQDICAAFFKSAVLTLPVFEEFCAILKDYIETQKKFNITVRS